MAQLQAPRSFAPRREAPPLAEVRYTSVMDDLALLWIPFGLILIVASVALMFVVMFALT